MIYTIEELAAMMGATRTGEKNATIQWLLTDSRSLCFPENTLFFALVGERNDGHDYLEELHAQGVRNFVVSRMPDAVPEDSNILLVDNTLKALQMLAAKHREKYEIPVVGITGSNGKTVIKEWIYSMFQEDYVVTRSPKSYNSQIGVPLSVWLLGEKSELGVFEAGISKQGEMQQLWKIIKPTIGVISNIGQAHQEGFSSLQEKCMEKISLFKECDVIIYDGDNELVCDCVNHSLTTAREIAWSRTDPEKPLFIQSINKHDTSTTVTYLYLGMENSYTIPFTDNASIENSINTLAVALYMMLPQYKIEERMARLEPVAMRLEVKEGKKDCILINDSYNSDLTSLSIALDFMARRSTGLPDKKRTLIISDMFQTGWSRQELARRVQKLMEGRQITRLIGIGTDIGRAEKFLHVEDKRFYDTTQEFLKSRTIDSFNNEIILIKGARPFEFDRITERLELKVHETILEVNLQSLANNLNSYCSRLKPSTKVVCMVKAGAYGTGAVEVSKTLQDLKVNYLAVAVADEGVELRKAGITTNIMVMNPERSSFHTLFDYKLEPEIYSFKLLEEFVRSAEHNGLLSYPIHIKIDTGMHRLGFDPSQMEELANRLICQTAVTPCSIFSHFAGSDSAEFDEFSTLQAQRFNLAADTLQSYYAHHIMRHICNSAAAERFPQYQYDMVRLGLGLYGVNPIDNSMKENVLTLTTTILQIHTVESPETVGYSRRGVVEGSREIAAIPIGYADGLNRHLGNGHAYCMVRGERAPYVGNICMDVCMIDVTGINCSEGDKVEIFGPGLPVSTLAAAIDTIPYEIIANLSTRIKRVFVSE